MVDEQFRVLAELEVDAVSALHAAVVVEAQDEGVHGVVICIIISIIGMSWPHEGMGLKSRSNDSCMATPS